MLKVKRTEIILITVSTLVAILFFKNQLANLFKADFKNKGYYYRRQFNSDLPWVNTNNLPVIGADLREDRVGFIYQFPKKNNERVILRLLFGKPDNDIEERYQNLRYVEVSGDSGWNKIFNYSDLHIGNTDINLTRVLSNDKGFTIRLKKLPSSQPKYNELMIRRLEVSVLPDARIFLPNLSLIITAVIMPFILFYCFKALGAPIILNFICSFAGLVIFYLLTHFFYNFMAAVHIFIILMLSLIYFLMIKSKKIKKSYTYLFFLIVLLIVSIYLRWSEVERLAFASAHPDVENFGNTGYRQLADKMKLFTKDGFFAVGEKQFHEPFYPLIAKLFIVIFGSSDPSLRFVSFFFSVLAVLLTYIVGKEIFNSKNIALLAAGLISINTYLIEQASLGLRLELEICFLLSLYYLSYLKREVLKDWAWVILSGVIGGLWLLTKTYSIFVILFIFAYSAWNNKKWIPIKKSILFFLASVISLSLILPYKFNMHKVQKSFFGDSTLYATDLANREFSGKPGFPKDKTTLSEYFFKLHTPQQFIGYHIFGAATIFYFLSEQIFNVINEQNYFLKVFMAEKFAGLIKYPILMAKIIIFSIMILSAILLCFIKKNTRSIIYVIILGNFQNLFLYGAIIIRRAVIIDAQRTIAHVLPFVSFCVAFFIFKIYRILADKLQHNLNK